MPPAAAKGILADTGSVRWVGADRLDHPSFQAVAADAGGMQNADTNPWGAALLDLMAAVHRTETADTLLLAVAFPDSVQKWIPSLGLRCF